MLTLYGVAQTPGETFTKISSTPLQPPQLAAFSKYIESPISYYNGTAQISLPVYEIKSGDMTVPITLSYHSGGLRVGEEASWVGLGWNLIAGGVIIRDIKGEDDDLAANRQMN